MQNVCTMLAEKDFPQVGQPSSDKKLKLDVFKRGFL